MYTVGQRWFSEGEPELGLGIIVEIEQKLISVQYPMAEESRVYNKASAPLKRFTLQEKDKLNTQSGEEYIVTSVQENNGIIFYLCDDQVIPEMELSAKIDLQGPIQRLMAQNFDSLNFFKLRYEAYLAYRHYQAFQYKGFLGAKIRLIPHQVYVVNEILKMDRPKAMLCDEVGLGKTIEACLVLHSLYQRDIVKKILIVVPDSLVNQWFIELYKKFNMNFIAGNSESLDEINFDETERLIISTSSLKESESLKEQIKAVDWDMLIIDESHQINFKNPEDTLASYLREINQNTVASLFLSATPEVLGTENLYSQLHCLDPDKYGSFEEFNNQIETSQKISGIIRSLQKKENVSTELQSFFTSEELSQFKDEDETIQALIDRFGTGRNYFRNSRTNLERFTRLFNDRILYPYSIDIKAPINDKKVFEHKANIIFEILEKYHNQKVLIICHSKVLVIKLQKFLMELKNFKIATFHSGQSLMERDRQAAYFADPDGASLLISTEIGSEGRNFEFSSHLVLFDLPKVPDQLEQRIGRLDRIGQKNDINVHVPFIKGTFEDILFHWYNNVLSAFTSSPRGAGHFYENIRQRLISIIEAPFDQGILDQTLDELTAEYNEYKNKLEQGRDLVVETHSYNDAKAKVFINEINDFEEKSPPLEFVEALANDIGIDIEELNDWSYFFKPSDNMLIPSYPGLTAEGLSITYDRDSALKHENISFLTWEHPIIQNGFELLLNSQLGNLVIAAQDEIERNIYFEFIATIQCSDKYKHKSELYLPFTPVRVLLNMQKTDVTKKYPKKFLDKIISSNVSKDSIESLKGFPKEAITELAREVNKLVLQRSEKYKKMAVEKIQTHFAHEKARLGKLHLATQDKQENLELLKVEEKQIITSACNPKISIDSLRLIIPKD